jgi:hypothetical protein
MKFSGHRCETTDPSSPPPPNPTSELIFEEFVLARLTLRTPSSDPNDTRNFVGFMSFVVQETGCDSWTLYHFNGTFIFLWCIQFLQTRVGLPCYESITIKYLVEEVYHHCQHLSWFIFKFIMRRLFSL